MVWKSTTKVGCVLIRCPALKFEDGNSWDNSGYLVCEYSPAGNVLGQFDQNVQAWSKRKLFETDWFLLSLSVTFEMRAERACGTGLLQTDVNSSMTMQKEIENYILKSGSSVIELRQHHCC
jgi:hypothetical protein